MVVKKKFVLDTNVILHDSSCLHSFENNDIILPITVLEEIDKFKKGNEQINYNAREFIREVDLLSKDILFKDGISLGKGFGRLFIEAGKAFSEKMKSSFSENIPDHRILAIAEYLFVNDKNSKIILISKDINLRLKARSLGIPAEDYTTDQVKDIDDILNTGVKKIDNVPVEFIEALYENKQLQLKDLGIEEFKGHRYLILKSSTSSVLAYYNPITDLVSKLEKRRAYGILPRNAEQTFSLSALLNKDIKLIALTGRAGTGKTLLALAAALELVGDYDQILLARPIVALANKDLGFLPGDALEKINPYMQPLFDNLNVIKHSFNVHSKDYLKINDLLLKDKLQITPLAYIRGRSLSKTFFIIDEAQNLTPHEVKTIITRAGEGTKMIFTGDVEQIDSPYLDKKSNGLAYLSYKMKGQDLFAHINLVKGERSYLAELASSLL